MADDLENKTKSYIRGLLTSSPLVITIKSLAFDYKNTIGSDIPFHRMGYSSLELFLKSIPDTVRVDGNGPFAKVFPVITPKTAHINDMVVRQKTTINRKGRFPVSKRHPQTKIQYPPMQTNSYSLNNSKQSSQSTNTYKATEKPITGYTNQKSKPIESPIKQQEIAVKPKEQETKKTPLSVRKHIPHTSKVDNHKTTNNGALKKVQNIPVVKSIKSYVVVPDSLQTELREVICRYPDGIWCSDLPYHYQKIFNKKLDFKAHGYRSLTNMCIDLHNVFHCIQPDQGDFLLFNASKPLPKYIDHINKNKTKDNTITQLKWTDCDEFIPDVVCKVGTIIPRQFVDHLKEDDLVDVVVVEIYDPSKFWIYLSDSPLDSLMDDMQTFYTKYSTQYLIPEFLLVEGLYCTQIIYKEYHRGLIVDSMPDVKGYVKILFIDYGTLTKVKTDGICYLHKQFSKLPWQQIKCRMPNIVPLDKIAPWPMSTISRFRELIKGRKIQARIGAINKKEEILEVYLADVTDELIFYLNDKLVDEGLAQYADKERRDTDIESKFSPIVTNLHLFPTFTELEYGIAPSHSDMMTINRFDIPLPFCIPQYFKTHGALDNDSYDSFHVTVLVSGKSVEHDYDIDQLKLSYFNFEIFGEYAEAMDEVFKEYIIYDEDPNYTPEVKPVKPEVDLSVSEENFRITNKLLLDLENELCADDPIDEQLDTTYFSIKSEIQKPKTVESQSENSSQTQTIDNYNFDEEYSCAFEKFANISSMDLLSTNHDFSNLKYTKKHLLDSLSFSSTDYQDDSDSDSDISKSTNTSKKQPLIHSPDNTAASKSSDITIHGQSEIESGIDLPHDQKFSSNQVVKIDDKTCSDESVAASSKVASEASSTNASQLYQTLPKIPDNINPIVPAPASSFTFPRPPPGFLPRPPQAFGFNVQNFYSIAPPHHPGSWYGSYPVAPSFMHPMVSVFPPNPFQTQQQWSLNDGTFPAGRPDFYDFYNQRYHK